MAFEILNVEQRSADWFQARCGRLTSSRANAMLAEPQKGKPGLRGQLRQDLAIEQLFGVPKDTGTSFRSRAMETGTEREPEALAYYEAVTGRPLRRTGFLSCTDLMAGASLDADFANCTGVIECKAPDLYTHIGYIKTQTIPLDYRRQITHQLFVSGAQWADFISYCPTLPEKGRLLILRVLREHVDLKAYELALRMFLMEVERERDELRELLGVAA